MAKIGPMFTSFILFGVIMICVVLGGFMFQSQNNVATNMLITNDTGLASMVSGLNQSITNASTQAGLSNGAFTNSSVTTTGTLPFLSAVGGIWKSFTGSITTIYNILVGFALPNLFGTTLSTILTSAFGAILIISIIIAVIYWISRGEGG